jgi:hypothetical protein
MPRLLNLNLILTQLIAAFPHFVQAFTENPPFTRFGQLEFHVETIGLRRTFGSSVTAVANDDFLESLYRTLKAWGIGGRASKLVPFPQFVEALQARGADIAAFDGMTIDDPQLNQGIISRRLWRTIEQLGIVENESKIVPGTKALHHILPDLVVPVDRAYTQTFFGWHNPEFQYGQGDFFSHSFATFVEIARRANPAQYVGIGWNSSRTKIIDNAIVGMLRG